MFQGGFMAVSGRGQRGQRGQKRGQRAHISSSEWCFSAVSGRAHQMCARTYRAKKTLNAHETHHVARL